MSSSGRGLAVSVLLLVVGYAALVPVSPASTVTPFQARTITPTTTIVTSTVLSTFRSATVYPAQTNWAVTSVSWSPSAPSVGDQVTFSMRITALSSTGPFPQHAEVACMLDSVVWDYGVVSYPGPVGFQFPVTSQKRWTATLGGHTLTCGVATVPAGLDPNPSNNMVTQSFNVSSTSPPSVQTSSVIQTSSASSILASQTVNSSSTPPPIIQTSSVIIQSSMITPTSTTESSTPSGVVGALQQNILLLIPILILAAFGGYFISRRTRTGGRTEQRLIKVPVSDTVHYQYWEQDGKRSLEGLVASNRWFPGIRIDGNFFYGLHIRDRFLPGIVSGERFVPGLVTERGFVPGVATDQGFQPGIIGMGFFVPGIVHGRNFVPGIVRDHHFLPGCFTVGHEFAPGRFRDGRFETGLVDETGTFASTGYERYSRAAIQSLSEKGFGISKFGASETVGGLPIRGTVVGVLGDQDSNLAAITPLGIVTNAGVILGGMTFNEHYPNLDRRTPLGTPPKQDATKQFGDIFGINPDDQFGIKLPGEGKGEDLPGEVGSLISGSFQDQMLGAGGEPNLGDELSKGLNQLSQGQDQLINNLNQASDDENKRVFGSGTGGVATEGGDDTSKKDDWADNPKKGFGDLYESGAVGAGIGSAIGSVVPGAGSLLGGLIGFAIGALYEGVSHLISSGGLSGSSSGGDDKGKGPPSSKPRGGGATEPDDEGKDTGGGAYNLTMAGYNPTLTHIENPRATTLIQWSQKEGEGVTSGGKKGLVNFVVSDTGLVTVLNYNALSRAAKLSGGKVGVGVDTLDPNNVYLNIWPVADQHQPTVVETLENMIMQPRTGGIGGEGKQVERG